MECEKCGEWYHDECIGLTEDETYNIEAYYCAPCCSENSSLVTKYKEDPVKLRQQIIAKVELIFGSFLKNFLIFCLLDSTRTKSQK